MQGPGTPLACAFRAMGAMAEGGRGASAGCRGSTAGQAGAGGVELPLQPLLAPIVKVPSPWDSTFPIKIAPEAHF